MRIPIQTAGERGDRPLGASASVVAAAAVLLCGVGSADAQTGTIACSVTENGSPAHGTMVVECDGRRVGSGSCDAAVSAPAGKCNVTVRLDGALDNPSKRLGVDGHRRAARAPCRSTFRPGMLEVRIETKGQRGTAMVTVKRGAKRIGTLGSGVAARLSTGTYEVVVRLGGEERRYSVDLRPGQRRLVRAQFREQTRKTSE